LSVPNSGFSFKRVIFCYLPKTCFKHEIPTGNIAFYSVY